MRPIPSFSNLIFEGVRESRVRKTPSLSGYVAKGTSERRDVEWVPFPWTPRDQTQVGVSVGQETVSLVGGATPDL